MKRGVTWALLVGVVVVSLSGCGQLVSVAPVVGDGSTASASVACAGFGDANSNAVGVCVYNYYRLGGQ